LLAGLATLVLTALPALAWLLALLAGFLLPAALLLALFAALLILLATLVRILVWIFVCHLNVSLVGAPRQNEAAETTFRPMDNHSQYVF
jgi:hypothetical protein